MFQQDITTGPGTGSMTSHTFEILIMLGVAFILGIWMGWVLWNRYRQEAERLRLDLASQTATAASLRTELDSSRTRLSTLEAEVTHLRSEYENNQRELLSARDKMAANDTLMLEVMARNRQLETELGLAGQNFAAPQPAPTVQSEIELEIDEPQPTFSEDFPDEPADLLLPTHNVINLVPTAAGEFASERPAPPIPDASPAESGSTIRIIDGETEKVMTLHVESPQNIEVRLDPPPSHTPPPIPDPTFNERPAPEDTEIDSGRETVRDFGFDLSEFQRPESHPLLQAQPEEDVSEPAPVDAPGLMPLPMAEDDLTVVEGIGPAIALILNRAGIHTFRQLAETDVTHIKDILENEGSHMEMHDPGTWPAQANLAANGQWETLNSVKSFLRAGKVN